MRVRSKQARQRIGRCGKRQNQLVGADRSYITKSKLRMCNLDDVARNRSKPAFMITKYYFKF